MKFTIEHPSNQGSIELLLILPLFLGIITLVSSIGYLMIKKTRLEKTAWTLQIQKIYGKAIDTVSPYVLRNVVNSNSLIWNYSAVTSPIPDTFRLFLLSHPVQSFELTFDSHFDPILQQFYAAAFDDSRENSFHLGSSFQVSEKNLERDVIYKNALWSENMRDAGFDYFLLQQLGFKEILDAAVPISRLASDIQAKFSGRTPEE